MSYFDDASLVMIPSGTKTSKVYSVKPIDGTGDLTFSRSNDTATRVASNGLIERVRTNLILQSNSFDTTWATSGTTLTSGQTGYDGLSDAWLLSKDAAANRYIFQSLSVSEIKTFSVYAKANTLNNVRLYSTTGTSSTADFSLVDGSLLASVSILGSSSEDLGNGWWRFSITTDGTASLFRIYPDPNGTTAGSIYFQDAQVETGDIATEPILTTSAAVSVGPLANVPRLDYLGSSCPRLILEGQRTNLMTYSESFDNADWTKTNSTITANADISPDGYTNADRIYDDAASGQHRVGKNISVVSATTYTFSVFAKEGSLRYCYLLTTAAGTTDRYYFDLQDGVSITAGGKIEDYGSGWYRISAQVTAAATGNELFTFNLTDSSSSPTYSGTGTGYHMIYGYQVEAGSYVSSYIGPTLGAAVTRGADAYHTNSLSSLHDTSSGFCLMFDYGQRTENADIAFQDFFSIQVSAGTQDGFRAEAAGSLNSEWRLYATNITASFGFPMVLSNIKTRNKVLLKVETTGIKIFADGALAVSQIGSVTIPTFNTLQSQRGTTQPAVVQIKQSLGMIYFSPLLDDADCIALTA
jgi:hypothetical protein